jgi:phosphonate transport system substrate-binding protein
VYAYIAEYVGRKLGCETEIKIGSSFDQFQARTVDLGFICGLPYVELARQAPSPVELLAAPVLSGERFQGQPIYFSDVIVKRDSPFHLFSDLRGCSWSFNDPQSQSGYGITRYWLARLGETRAFFGKVIEAGFHQRSIELVRDGEVDASAIDCQVLAVALRDDPALVDQLRIIASLGPSTIQPVVASSHLPQGLREELRAVLLEMGQDPAARQHLAAAFIERFTPVEDKTYDDIRQMLAISEAAGIVDLRQTD